MARCGAAVLTVVLAAGFVAALPHWHGHNHHGRRSHHGHDHNHQTLPADSFKDLFPQHHHRGFHTREHRHHYLPHYPTRWSDGQTTDEHKTSQNPLLVWSNRPRSHPFPPSGQAQSNDDQKMSLIIQPLLGWQPHSWHHHSHSWSLDRTKYQEQETLSNHQPLSGWPHRPWSHSFSTSSHGQTTDDQKSPQNPQPLTGWRPHSSHHHSHWWSRDRTKNQAPETLPIPQPLLEWPHRRHDHSFHGRRHHWPHWTRWNHDQITANEESQQIHPHNNNKNAVKVEEITVKNNKDNAEVQKVLVKKENLNESPQNIEEQKIDGLKQTVKDMKDESANLDLESNKKQEDIALKNDKNIKNRDTEKNLALHLLTKCQTINEDGIKIKLNNEFCFWPEQTAEITTLLDESTTVCEEKAIIPDVLMPDDKYLITGQFEMRIECRELPLVQDDKDHDVSEQTDAIPNKYKHEDIGFANTNDKNSENVKVQYDNTAAKISDATMEMPAAIVNNSEAEEKQSDKDDKHHVVLLQRAGETGLYIPQNAYEIPKDKDIPGGRNFDNVVESNLNSLKHNDEQDEKVKDIDILMKKMFDAFVESFSDSPKQEDVQEEKNPPSTNNIKTKGGTEEIVESFSDVPTDYQEEKMQTSTDNDKIMKDIDKPIESIFDHLISPEREDVHKGTTETTVKKYDVEINTHEPIEGKIQLSKKKLSDIPTYEKMLISVINDKIKEDNDEPIESISDNPKPEDEQETFSNNYETVEQLIDELNESISDSPVHTDEEKETTTNNDEIKKDSDELNQSNSVSPKHEDVQEETTETPTKKDDIERNTDKPQGDDFYIRDLFEVIDAS